MTEWIRLLRTQQPYPYRLARVTAPTVFAAAAAWLVTGGGSTLPAFTWSALSLVATVGGLSYAFGEEEANAQAPSGVSWKLLHRRVLMAALAYAVVFLAAAGGVMELAGRIRL